MTQDLKNPWEDSPPSSSSVPLHNTEHEHEGEFDLPPSYDSTLATGPTGPSGSSSSHAQPSSGNINQVSQRVIPDHLKYCFVSPSNAEPLFRDGEPLPDVMSKIEWRSRGKYIESWDHRLSDPNVLYDYLRAMTMTLPSIKIRCLGSHTETWERDETVWENGTAHTKKKGEMHHVVDFDFTIDLTEIIDHPSNNAHIHLSSAPPWAPLLRGTNTPRYAATYAPDVHPHGHKCAKARRRERRGYRTLPSDLESAEQSEYSSLDLGRRPIRQEAKDSYEWDTWRKGKGIPRWVHPDDCPEYWETKMKGKGRASRRGEPTQTTGPISLPEAVADLDLEAGEETTIQQQQQQQRSVGDLGKPDLKQWCEAFCADKGILKEFVLVKGVWGWDQAGLLTAVNSAIMSTGYPAANIQTSFDMSPTYVVVRPNNTLSRALGNTFIYFLLWITLIYPCIWIWKRVHPSGGGTWSLARASYAMKFYPPLPSTFPSETIDQARDRLPSLIKLHPEIPAGVEVKFQYGPKGVHYLLGRKEGEWYREWEERIRMGVRTRFKGELQGGTVPGTSGTVDLDGY
nr:uncharacterized protein CI109_002202 [Kwoniella shandongensis]KAA5529309.1 hypothetical protein CI109_002202 [Kwoniella shandongensis]